MRRTIRECGPSRPSTRLSTMHDGELSTAAKHRHTDAPKLIHLVRGDLDWIVMRCLEKDRTRRYQTANRLTLDTNFALVYGRLCLKSKGPIYENK